MEISDNRESGLQQYSNVERMHFARTNQPALAFVPNQLCMSSISTSPHEDFMFKISPNFDQTILRVK